MKKLAVAFCACFLVISMVQADPNELAVLKQILEQRGGTWTAAENSFSQLDAITQESMMGLLPGVGDMQNLPVEIIVDMPESRGKNEAPHTSIKDQGQCGSCYSFGACAVYESNRMKKGKGTYDLSEQWFMMRAKAIGPYGGCSGWYLDTSMNLMKDNSLPNENDCPYKASEQECPSTAKGEHKIGSWACTTDLNTIKAALDKNGAVYVGFAVYSDFSYYSSGVYRYSSGYRRGYHAVCIVGYDDEQQAFKVKNSWGTGWGDGGYFWIGYDQMNNVIQFGTCFGGSYYITD